MAYKIAVVTSDGIKVDGHFGSAQSFLIYQVDDTGTYEPVERREFSIEKPATQKICSIDSSNGGCSTTGGNGCGSGSGGGCGGHSDPVIEKKTELIEDCRSLLCVKCGPKAEKQLQRKAITVFAIDMEINQALDKIIPYFDKLDNHISLRKG